MIGSTAIRPRTTSAQVTRQGVNARILEATRLERRAQARSRMVQGAKSVSLRLGLGILAVAASALAVGYVWRTASDPRWSGLRAVEVRGAPRQDPGRLVRESGLVFGTGLAQLDLRAVEGRLLSDPWIARVEAKRRWPHRVVIEIREREPVAQVSAERWIASDGTVVPRRGNASLPRFSAKGFPRGRVPRSLALPALDAVGGMSAAGVTEFDQVSVLRDGGLELRGGEGGPSVLVSPSDWRKGLARWGALRVELGARSAQFSEIDLRHGPCAALRRLEGGV